nr:hypothetical protein [Morchella crassipes]
MQRGLASALSLAPDHNRSTWVQPNQFFYIWRRGYVLWIYGQEPLTLSPVNPTIDQSFSNQTPKLKNSSPGFAPGLALLRIDWRGYWLKSHPYPNLRTHTSGELIFFFYIRMWGFTQRERANSF